MKSILVTMLISLLLLKPNGGGQKPVENYSSVQYKGREYKVEEWGMPPGSQIKPVHGFYINGYHIIPKEIKHRGAVIVFGGANGTDLWSAMTIAYHGYEVYAMHIYKWVRQTNSKEQVPLELFAELYQYIQWTAQSPKPLTIYGSSLGAELGLLLASTFPEQVDHLILFAPSAYVFQNIYSNPPCSPWTFQGKELPFISTDGSEEMKTKHLIAIRDNTPLSTLEFCRYGIEHDKNREKARINLAPVRAKMLLFAFDTAGYAAAARVVRHQYQTNLQFE